MSREHAQYGIFKFDTADECPDRDKHTKSPTGYLQWHDWAEKMMKTNSQHRCPTCGFWAIWKPLPPSPWDEEKERK